MFIEKIEGTRNFRQDTITAEDCEKMMRTVGQFQVWSSMKMMTLQCKTMILPLKIMNFDVQFQSPWVHKSNAPEIAWVPRPNDGGDNDFPMKNDDFLLTHDDFSFEK